jgi:hypothetical protein
MKVARLLAILPISAAAVLAGSGSAQVASASTYICQSTPGWYYAVTTNHGLVFDGKPTAVITHNGTQNTETLTKSVSSTGNVGWSVNGSLSISGGYDFGVVSSGVKLSVGGSYSSSTSSTQTSSVSITINPGYYGIIQGGVYRRWTTGTYAYETSNCTTQQSTTIDTKLPLTADATDTATNKTGTIPWDQQ